MAFTGSGIKSVDDLPGKTVCVLDGSTTLQHTRKLAPESPIMKVRSSADCLVALQQNQADVIMSDDAVLSGIAAQDPYTSIVGDAIATESYGIAIGHAGGEAQHGWAGTPGQFHH